MTGISFERKISTGHILTMVVMISGLVVGWFTLVADTKANTSEIVRHDARITRLETAGEADRLQQTKLLTEMQVDLRYMRQAIEQLQRQGRPPSP